MPADSYQLDHVATLESEAIHIIREMASERQNPALLFSGGKDSAVLLHLAQRAFWPATVPFPAVHVDTGHNFPEVIAYRDRYIKRMGVPLIVVSIPEMIERGQIQESPGEVSRNRLQSAALLSAIEDNGFDALFGGARRDEEKARAKERICSFRDDFGQWEPREQRPEVWHLYNSTVRSGEHVRVFPLSNWTEADIWRYISSAEVEIPDIYYAHQRQVFERDGVLYAENDWLRPREGEQLREETVRFRTVGDMTCTGAVPSSASSVEEIIAEIEATRVTERGQTRADDRATDSAMEDRKREGYF